MSVVADKLVQIAFGDAANVVKLDREELQPPKLNEVLVRMLAAPVNPADINALQGVYASKPALPTVPGNEGVGEVLSVGPGVEGLEPGDRVTARTAMNWGTWRTHAVCDAKLVYKIPKELGVVEAATMSVNPYTAYRMLKDFVQLSKGDTVIQNGANSACGQCIIQLCREWGYRSINIVRDRPNISELKQYLMDLGATYVFTEEELRNLEELLSGKDAARPKLALNCIGGESGELLAKQLDHGGVMVTYGNMSRQPVPARAPLFIFNDLTWQGFWVSAWMRKHAGSPQHLQMKDHVTQLLLEGKLRAPPHKMVPITAFKEALGNTASLKYIFDLQN